MSNSTFIQFVESFKGIISIMPVKEIEKFFTKINLPLEKENGLTFLTLPYNQKNTLANFPAIQKILYMAFLGDDYDSEICTILNKNILFLENKCDWIKNNNHAYLKEAYRKKIKAAIGRYFWELFYEIDILTYFEKNVGKITYLEPPEKKSSNSSRTLDFHLDIEKGQKIHVEIMTLSESAHDELVRKHEKELNRIFKGVFPELLPFHFYPEKIYNYTKDDLRNFRKKLIEKRADILKKVSIGEDYRVVFNQAYADKSEKKVEYVISSSNYYDGICIISVDPLKNYDYENDFKKIPQKYLEKKNAFPDGGLNFLLVNISCSNRLSYCYLERDKSTHELNKAIKQWKTKPYYWLAIDRFEKPFIDKDDFDENLSSIIFHRYIGPDLYSDRKLDIYQNPISLLEIPQALYDIVSPKSR